MYCKLNTPFMKPTEQENSRRCLLVDGHGLLYRAFFALPVMTTRDGRHTNALFGFVRMLNQLRRDWQPSHVAVLFDAGLPEHRMTRLPDYKAQRPAMPPTLREQIDYIRDYLDTIGVPVASVDGEEADDVAATLVTRLLCDKDNTSSVGDEILIASSDKDLFQLVNDRVSLVSPAGQSVRIDVGHVIRKTGVPPERIVAWLALIGDTADNIPGVPGIGPKTASRLLNDYGTLDQLWQRLPEIRAAGLRDALQSNHAIVDRNVELMTLRHNLPVAFSTWQDLALTTVSPSGEDAFFERYEMTPPPEKGKPRPKPAPVPAAEEQGILGL